MGSVFKKQGDLNAAMQHFSSAVSLNPRHPDALYNRGVILMEDGQLEAAKKHFARVLDISPGYEAARLDLEEVNKRIGKAKGSQNN